MTDAILALLGEHPVLLCVFEGTRFDCGCKFGYLQACVEFSLQHAEMGEKFSNYLRANVSKHVERKAV